MMFLQIDFPAMLVALLAALSAALVGNVLVLRRQALMGDALSHMVLPGVVGSYILTGDTKSWSMVFGALVAALTGTGLIVMIRRLGRLDAATAMGVVLTMLFALGVVMLELADSSNVHLDIEHTLYGSLEAAIWIGPLTWQEALQPAQWTSLPREIPMLLAVLAVLAIAMLIAFKEIRLAAFDPDYGAALGLPAWVSELAINTAAALAVVAAFDAVGSILVIAMLICPAASARLITDRLAAQIYVSLLIAGAVAIGGYGAAAWAAPAIGLPAALNAAGTIAVTGGVALAIAAGWSAFRRHQTRAAKPAAELNS